MKLSWRLKEAWRGFSGRYANDVLFLKTRIGVLREQADKATQLERDLGFAKAAIADLRRYQNEDERKEWSDRIADTLVENAKLQKRIKELGG